MKNFFNTIMNWFRSNKVIAQYAVMEAAQQVFANNSNLKAAIPGLMSSISSALNATTTVASIPALIKSQVNLTKLDPASQVLAAQLVDQVSVAAMAWFAKDSSLITESSQVAAVTEILGWVNAAAKA